MSWDFQGKQIVVTGGANGIGLAISRSLAAAGGSVWIFDLPEANPAEAAQSIGAQACAVDIADRRSTQEAFARVPDPSVVVVNAGIAPCRSLFETTPDLWDRVLSINLFSYPADRGRAPEAARRRLDHVNCLH
jgi:3-oxoacyl-[acyl-carrier protein] reductase